MFTGIVRELGVFEGVERRLEGARVRVRAPETAAEAQVGDSIALNGVCLTAVEVRNAQMTFDVVRETLKRSTLDRVQPGDHVNVERAVRAGEPLGGHIVQGHVDGVARVRLVEREGDGKRIVVEVPPELERYCVEKGSIAIDGVSVTVANVLPGAIVVALVPHTLRATTLGRIEAGDPVNVEVDLVAKQVERLLEARGRLS
ncbi:MAG TPA: riboflavin synthase [Gaiellaceae bacterium]|nr:riboflavin synthase [Gaiellaceae bacterium]